MGLMSPSALDASPAEAAAGRSWLARLTSRPAVVRAASGERRALASLTREHMGVIRGAARRNGAGFVLMGAAAFGRCLPFEEDLRPGLTLLLVDAERSSSELDALAVALQAELSAAQLPFPVRVLARLRGRYHRFEEDFIETAMASLRTEPSAAEARGADLRAEAASLYAPVALPRRLLTWSDFWTAVLGACVFTASFSIGLGFHWIAPVLGFTYGLLGRYLARIRAGIAFALGDGPAGNAAALAYDAVHGAALFGLIIDPAAGLGIPWARVLSTSVTHTLSKGALRLVLDKRFSTGREQRQSWGVVATTVLDFAQGVVTSFVYAGAQWAFILQASLAVVGLYLLFVRRPREA